MNSLIEFQILIQSATLLQFTSTIHSRPHLLKYNLTHIDKAGAFDAKRSSIAVFPWSGTANRTPNSGSLRFRHHRRRLRSRFCTLHFLMNSLTVIRLRVIKLSPTVLGSTLFIVAPA